MHRTALACTSIVSLTLLALGAMFAFGPLTPPGGAVTSTAKPLSEVEPRIAISAANTPGDADSLFKITQPGSYYLTGNITGVVGKHGIEIVASGVTLDLMGFNLAGVPAMGAFDGVISNIFNATNIVVLNGTVRNWGEDGINLGSNFATGCRVEGIQASSNVRIGVYAGANAVVWKCSATSGQYGVLAGAGSMVTECSVTTSSSVGIFADSGCTVTNCSARSNTGIGISVTNGCSLSNCSAYQNTGNGIVTGDGCTLLNCRAYDNDVNGIFAGAGCTLTSCTASLNTATGIVTGVGGTITNCSAYANVGGGISGSTGCTITHCSAHQNTTIGIGVLDGSTIADCTVRSNTLDGIQCYSACIIRGNTCYANGFGVSVGAGIHAIGGRNRIEGNTCTGADRGIDVDILGNIIIKNTCSGNIIANWDVVTGNIILVVQGSSAGSVVGNTGGLAPGSTDPNANFTY